jgi:hypothetical protein
LSATPTIRPEEFGNIWNRNRSGLPKIDEFTESRRKKVQTRIRQGITPERFMEAVKCCTTKPFLRGDNRDGWMATFDWLVENDRNIGKAINEYNGAGSTPSPPKLDLHKPGDPVN